MAPSWNSCGRDDSGKLSLSPWPYIIHPRANQPSGSPRWTNNQTNRRASWYIIMMWEGDEVTWATASWISKPLRPKHSKLNLTLLTALLSRSSASARPLSRPRGLDGSSHSSLSPSSPSSTTPLLLLGLSCRTTKIWNNSEGSAFFTINATLSCTFPTPAAISLYLSLSTCDDVWRCWFYDCFSDILDVTKGDEVPPSSLKVLNHAT